MRIITVKQLRDLLADKAPEQMVTFFLGSEEQMEFNGLTEEPDNNVITFHFVND